MRRRFLPISITAALMLGLAPPVSFAQVPTDSFFDIFADVKPVDPQCEPCQALKDEIAKTQAEIDRVRFELTTIDISVSTLDTFITDFEEMQAEAEKQLEEMNNPKDYVESDGRRFDSSDSAALKQRNRNLWKSYKRGGLTAEEYSEEIGKPFDHPDVQEDLKLLKEIIKMQLQEEIDDLQKSIDRAAKLRDSMIASGEKFMGELDALLDALEKLMDQLEDCLKRCMEEPINLPEDYQIGQESKGFLISFLDSFRGLFKDTPALPDLEDLIKKLEDPAVSDADALRLVDDLVKKLQEEDLPTPTPSDASDVSPPAPTDDSAEDDFMDLFDEETLKRPVCHLCDPLLNEILDAQDALSDMKWERNRLLNEENDLRNSRSNTQDVLSDAKRALESFDTPSGSAESEGRRLDSNDQAAMRVRNAGLWASYKAGDISAGELESEWGKPFDDPAVKEELEEIKKKMREELADAVKAAEDVIKNLNAEIDALAEPISELGQSIAVHEVILRHLYDQLDECLKRCVEVKDQEPAVALPDFTVYLFPKDPEGNELPDFSEDPEERDDEEASEDREPKNEGNQDDSPAEGVMEPGDTEEYEMKPDAEATDDSWICEWTGLMCPPKEEVEVVVEEVEMKPDEEKADAGWMCEWTGLFCPDTDVQYDDSASSASANSSAAVCDEGTMLENDCKASCDGTCEEKYEDFGGPKCFICNGKIMATEICPRPTETEAECRKDCFGDCVKKYDRKDGVGCFNCVAYASSAPRVDDRTDSSSSASRQASSKPKLMCDDSMERDVCEKTCDGTCLSAYIRDDNVTCYTCVADKDNPCPIGTTPDQLGCEKLCRPEGGTCKSIQENGCYSCVIPEPEVKETSGPTVVSTTPANGNQEVPVDTVVRIVFSTPMSRKTLESAVAASFAYDYVQVNETTIDVVAKSPFEYKTDYEVRVSTLATDTSGKPLVQSLVLRFRTQNKPSTTPPPAASSTWNVTEPVEIIPPSSSRAITSASAASSTPAVSSQAASSAAQATVQVLVISGKKYPIVQFVVEDHDDCPAHYHAANGFLVQSIDNSAQLPEPGGCIGYGTVPSVPKQMCTPNGSECF